MSLNPAVKRPGSNLITQQTTEYDIENVISSHMSGDANTDDNIDFTNELDILSISSNTDSQSSIVILLDNNYSTELPILRESNNGMDIIDDWSMNNELRLILNQNFTKCQQSRSTESQLSISISRSPSNIISQSLSNDMIRDTTYLSPLLQNLNVAQLNYIKQLSQKLIPILRSSRHRQSQVSHNRKYTNIPSVFTRDENDMLFVYHQLHVSDSSLMETISLLSDVISDYSIISSNPQ